jgi:hypothetical protein
MPTQVIKEAELRQHQAELKKRAHNLELQLQYEGLAVNMRRDLLVQLQAVHVSLAWVDYLLGETGHYALTYRHLLPPY